MLEAGIESSAPILSRLPAELETDYEIRRIPLRRGDGFGRGRTLALVVRRDSDVGLGRRR